MSGRAGKVRSRHRRPPSDRTFTTLRRFGIPIGKDGRLYAPYRLYGADWKAGELITRQQARQIIEELEKAGIVQRATSRLEAAKEQADQDRTEEA